MTSHGLYESLAVRPLEGFWHNLPEQVATRLDQALNVLGHGVIIVIALFFVLGMIDRTKLTAEYIKKSGEL